MLRQSGKRQAGNGEAPKEVTYNAGGYRERNSRGTQARKEGSRKEVSPSQEAVWHHASTQSSDKKTNGNDAASQTLMIAWMWPPTCSEENPFNLSEVYSRLATQRQLHALMDLLPLSRNNSSADFLG